MLQRKPREVIDLRFDWMLMSNAMQRLAKGNRRCSSPARLARWLRKHETRNVKPGVVVWFRRCDRNGTPLETWETRPLAAR